MDHAEVRAWLEEAFFRPGALRRLEEDDGADTPRQLSPSGVEAGAAEVRAHLRGCSACAQELRSLRATGVALDVGLGPSPAARERTLARIRQLGRQRESAVRPVVVADRGRAAAPAPPVDAARRRPATLRWAAALLVALLAFASGALFGLSWPAQEPAGPRLELAAAMMGDLLTAPDARPIQLRDASDAPAGLVVHSVARQQLAVLSSALERPASGRYQCYLERDGERTLIGPMHFEGDTAFWAGPVGGPPDAGRSDDRLVIVLDGESEPVLWGEF